MFVERLWRSVKYEEVYLRAYGSVSEARSSIGRYQRWLCKSGQRVKWSFCLKAAKMAAEQEFR